jgi:hypothetical protein
MLYSCIVTFTHFAIVYRLCELTAAILMHAGETCGSTSSSSSDKRTARKGKRPKGVNGKRTGTNNSSSSNGHATSTADATTDSNSSTTVDDDSLLYTEEDRINDTYIGDDQDDIETTDNTNDDNSSSVVDLEDIGSAMSKAKDAGKPCMHTC